MTLIIVNGKATSWNWNKVESPINESFKSVSMVDPNNGWAVAWNGVIIRWDGTRWNNVTSPTKADLKSIDMVSSN